MLYTHLDFNGYVFKLIKTKKGISRLIAEVEIVKRPYNSTANTKLLNFYMDELKKISAGKSHLPNWW